VIYKNNNTNNTIISDRLIFSLIFKHLFKNAISFQDSGKKNKYVDIQLDATGDLLKLTLKDNGIGIPAAYHQKIFKPFFRASSQSNGQGMGLFLLNNLLNKINASISLKSAEHSGTTIIILIPSLK
jgi:signal transduction histidine kinase